MSHPPERKCVKGNLPQVSRRFCRYMSAVLSRPWPDSGEIPTIMPKIPDIRPLTGDLYVA